MTTYVPTASSIGPTFVFTSVAAGDSLTLLQPYTFINTTDNAVVFDHANNTLMNMTTLMSGSANGVTVNGVADCNIINTATGTIATLYGINGYYAIYLSGDRNSLLNAGDVYSVNGTGVLVAGNDSVIDNSGRIQGLELGVVALGMDYSILNSGTIECGIGTSSTTVFLSGSGNGKSLVNTGVIQSLTTATFSLAVQVVGNGLTTIDNAGTIRSVGSVAIDASLAPGSIHLTNSGTIISSTASLYSVVGTAQADVIINSGSINRSVGLGGGDDLFDGSGGFVGGTVFGGDGNDFFRVSDTLVRIFELAAQGTNDRVESTVSFSLAATGEVESLFLRGTATDGTGNEYNNFIVGNGMDNRLFGKAGLDTLYGGDGDDSLRGGAAADSLYGGEDDDILRGDAGADRLYGENGDDVLHGGAGRDTLYGGADADLFVFRFVADSGAGTALRDQIVAFEAGLDLIDLTQIDANAILNGNQAFTWIGTAAFGNIAGQLRLVTGANSVLQGDVTGDGVADFEVQFNATATVSVNDLIL